MVLGLGTDKPEYSVRDVPDQSGKTALITGGTTGVGLEVAKVLACKGARTLVLARREDSPDDALEDIRTYCKDNNAREPELAFVECDLANLAEVKRIGDEICSKEKRLDILVCDAGVGVQTFDVSADGIDRHFAVNHLGHFLLINRLLPLLQRTAFTPLPLPSPSPSPSPSSSSPSSPPAQRLRAPRIVCVTSTLHVAAPFGVNFISYAELTAESYAASSPLALYARAKLSSILFVKFGLAPRLNAPPSPPSSSSPPPSSSSPPPSTSPPNDLPTNDSPANGPDRAPRARPRGILALAADPGPIHPGQPDQLAEAYGPILGPLAKVATTPLERTPADAARSTLWAATAPELDCEGDGDGEGKREGEWRWEEWQGAYVSEPGRRGGESALAQDEERGRRLWEMSEDLVRKRLGEGALRPWTWAESGEDGDARVDGSA
ncbi:NAD(P)-binding protein [Trametes cingulata]|nr:NAD(P)-binding protein [Trametes cingulata]